jgi:hypothetical protein
LAQRWDRPDRLRHLTWQQAIRHGHPALTESEQPDQDSNTAQSRSNPDIENHLRRADVKATQAQVWLALASELGSQGERYGHPGT